MPNSPLHAGIGLSPQLPLLYLGLALFFLVSHIGRFSVLVFSTALEATRTKALFLSLSYLGKCPYLG